MKQLTLDRCQECKHNMASGAGKIWNEIRICTHPEMRKGRQPVIMIRSGESFPSFCPLPDAVIDEHVCTTCQECGGVIGVDCNQDHQEPKP